MKRKREQESGQKVGKVIKLYIKKNNIFSPKFNFPVIKAGSSVSFFFKHHFHGVNLHTVWILTTNEKEILFRI